MSGVDKSPLRALIYNRVSVDRTGAGVSVASQEAENRAWCAREGWEVAGVVTDNDRSATRYARREREGYAAVQRALAGETHGRIDILVCWESSRANRSLDGYTELRLLCARYDVRYAYRGRVLDLTDGDDRFTAGLDALLDEREAEKARDRTLRSHRASVAAGKPRSFAPYGYTRTYDPHSRRLAAQVPDPETAPVVQGIVARLLAGEGLYRIAADLNAAGVLSPRAHAAHRRGVPEQEARWTSSVIRNLLAKPSLMGVRTHRGQPQGDAAWEPIVSPADWRQVQQILADPSRRAVESRDPAHLLSGIATCGVCGGWMRPLTNRGRATYVCGGRLPTAGKGHVARARDPLDAAVVAVVCDRLAYPDVLSLLAPGRDGDVAAAAAREVADLTARLAAFEESAIAGGISAAAFGRIEARLTAELEDARRRSVPRSVPEVLARVAGPDAVDRWHGLTLVEQRQIVRALLAITVHRSTRPRGARGIDLTGVEITLR